MGFRFRRSIRLGKGLRINVSKSGTSLSVGHRGATVNFGPKGEKVTVGLPGTGLSYSKTIQKPGSADEPASRRPSNQTGAPIIFLAFVVILAIVIAITCLGATLGQPH